MHARMHHTLRRENAATYSASSEGQKVFGVFSETAPLQRALPPLDGHTLRPFFLLITRMRIVHTQVLHVMQLLVSSPCVLALR